CCMSSRDTTPKKKSRHKEPLAPISMDEILAGPGMSGCVAILDPPEAVPHMQALVDDIRDMPLLTVTEGQLRGGRFRAEPDSAADVAVERPSKQAGANVIHLRRRGGGAEADKPPPVQQMPEEVSGPERGPGAERDTGSILP